MSSPSGRNCAVIPKKLFLLYFFQPFPHILSLRNVCCLFTDTRVLHWGKINTAVGKRRCLQPAVTLTQPHISLVVWQSLAKHKLCEKKCWVCEQTSELEDWKEAIFTLLKAKSAQPLLYNTHQYPTCTHLASKGKDVKGVFTLTFKNSSWHPPLLMYQCH